MISVIMPFIVNYFGYLTFPLFRLESLDYLKIEIRLRVMLVGGLLFDYC